MQNKNEVVEGLPNIKVKKDLIIYLKDVCTCDILFSLIFICRWLLGACAAQLPPQLPAAGAVRREAAAEVPADQDGQHQ